MKYWLTGFVFFVFLIAGMTLWSLSEGRSTSGVEDSTFYLRTYELWYYGPYRMRQGEKVAPLRTRNPSDMIIVRKHQTYLEAIRAQGFQSVDLSRAGSGHFEIAVRYKASTGYFLIDSGAGNNIIFRSFSELCGIKGRLTPTSIGMMNITELKGARTSEDFPVAFSQVFLIRPDQDRLPKPDEAIAIRWESVGIIGAGFLREYRAILDYGSDTLFLSVRKSDEPSARLKKELLLLGYHPIRLQWRKNLGFWNVPVNIGTNTVEFTVDTGSSTTSVDSELANRLHIEVRDGATQPMTGVDHRAGAKAGRSQLCSLTVDGVQADFGGVWVTSKGNHNGSDDAILGNDLLALYSAVLDFGAETLYLKPPSAK
jgi:predicted aspartyl protease